MITGKFISYPSTDIVSYFIFKSWFLLGSYPGGDLSEIFRIVGFGIHRVLFSNTIIMFWVIGLVLISSSSLSLGEPLHHTVKTINNIMKSPWVDLFWQLRCCGGNKMSSQLKRLEARELRKQQSFPPQLNLHLDHQREREVGICVCR